MEYVLLGAKSMPLKVAKELGEIEGVCYVDAERRLVGYEFDITHTEVHKEVIGVFRRAGILLTDKSTHPNLEALMVAAKEDVKPVRFTKPELKRVLGVLAEHLDARVVA